MALAWRAADRSRREPFRERGFKCRPLAAAAHDGNPSGRGALNVDRWQRVHGHDNLFVLDGSVHVTNGGFNPVLTIMALAWRAADRILAQW